MHLLVLYLRTLNIATARQLQQISGSHTFSSFAQTTATAITSSTTTAATASTTFSFYNSTSFFFFFVCRVRFFDGIQRGNVK